MRWSICTIVMYVLVAAAWGLAAAAFVLYQTQASDAIAKMRQISRTVQLSESVQHQLHLFDACRWAMLGIGLPALLLFPVALYAAKFSSKRIFLANWGRGEKDGLKRRSQIVRGSLISLCVLLFIAGGVTVASVASIMKALDTVESAQNSVQSASSLLNDASSTLTTLKGGDSSSTGIGTLLSTVSSLASSNSSAPSATGLTGLFSSLANIGGSDEASSPPSSETSSLLNSILNIFTQSSTTGSSLYDLLTKDNLEELAPILKQMTVGTLLDAIDSSQAGLLQLLTALGSLISSSSENSCSTGCLQTDQACICAYSQLESLTGMFAPTTSDLKRAMIGSCLLLFALVLLFVILAKEAASYGFQEALVYSTRFDRQLAVKNAMQTSRNLNILAYTPREAVPVPTLPTQEKVEAKESAAGFV